MVGGHMGRGITRGRWPHGARNHLWSVVTWGEESPVVGGHMGRGITRGRWPHGTRNHPWSVITLQHWQLKLWTLENFAVDFQQQSSDGT